jgi:hypothetical protein
MPGSRVSFIRLINRGVRRRCHLEQCDDSERAMWLVWECLLSGNYQFCHPLTWLVNVSKPEMSQRKDRLRSGLTAIKIGQLVSSRARRTSTLTPKSAKAGVGIYCGAKNRPFTSLNRSYLNSHRKGPTHGPTNVSTGAFLPNTKKN